MTPSLGKQTMDGDNLAERRAKADYYDPATWEAFVREGDTIGRPGVSRLDGLGLTVIEAMLQRLENTVRLEGGWAGYGRSKTAYASVLLLPGSGAAVVNGVPLAEYFEAAPRDAQEFLRKLVDANEVRGVLHGLNTTAQVTGSRPTAKRQVRALAHALARALMKRDSALRVPLMKLGFGGVDVPEHD